MTSVLPWIVRASLLGVALVHLAPTVGVLGPASLAALYGVPCEGDVAILMRHRAVLFGIVGGLSLWAIGAPALEVPAMAVGFVSMVSFLALVAAQGAAGPMIRRIALVDRVALVWLSVGAAARAAIAWLA